MAALLRRFGRDARANAAVEFALIAPVFVMTLIGMVDYGQAARQKSQLEAAARAGLQAVLEDDTDTIGARDAAQAVAPDASVAVATECECNTGSSVACNGTCTTGAVRKWVTVTASDSFQLLVPWPGFEDPLPLEGVARARVQ